MKMKDEEVKAGKMEMAQVRKRWRGMGDGTDWKTRRKWCSRGRVGGGGLRTHEEGGGDGSDDGLAGGRQGKKW